MNQVVLPNKKGIEEKAFQQILNLLLYPFCVEEGWYVGRRYEFM